MGAISGGFTLPAAQRTSQLINDTRFSSIREYVLNATSLAGSTQIEITDLEINSIIYRIDLVVMSAFSNATADQHSITVKDVYGEILMDAEWNDPNTVGTYSTNCYTTVKSTSEPIRITHTLSDMLTGSALLRLYVYNNINEYTRMLTSDNLYYRTVDEAGVNVTVSE